MLYGIKNTSEYIADYIVEAGNKTYLCCLNPMKMDPNSQLPVEQQPVWKICCIETTEQGGKKITTAKYPNGCATAYNYAAADCQILNYDFQK